MEERRQKRVDECVYVSVWVDAGDAWMQKIIFSLPLLHPSLALSWRVIAISRQGMDGREGRLLLLLLQTHTRFPHIATCILRLTKLSLSFSLSLEMHSDSESITKQARVPVREKEGASECVSDWIMEREDRAAASLAQE